MKKILMWVLVLLMSITIVASFSLVGCKEEVAEEEVVPAEEEVVEEEVEEVKEEVEEEVEEVLGVQPPEEPVLISLVSWALFDPAETEWDPYYEMFREKYPTIEIEVTRPMYADHFTLLKTGFAAGEGPDLFGGQVGAPMYELVSYLEPLDAYCVQEWGENWQDKFSKAAMDQVHWVSDDTLALVEYVQCLGGMWYNKTMFDELGLDVPVDYDALLEVADVLRSAGYTPWAHSAGEGWTSKDFFINISTQFAGDKYWKAENGEISWTDPDLVAAMEAYKKMFDDNLFGEDPFTGVMYWDYITRFYEEGAGMLGMGNWETGPAILPDITRSDKQNPETVFRPMEIPDLNGDGQYSKGAVAPATIWMINKDIDESKKRAAFIVIKELVDGIFAQHRADTLNWVASNSIKPDPDLYTPEQLEVIEFWSEKVENAIGFRDSKYPELAEVIQNSLQEVAIGIKTPLEGLEAIQELSESMERPF